MPPTTTATTMSQNMPHQGRPGVGQSAGPPGGGYMSRPNQNFGPYGSPHGPSSPQSRITELPPDSPQKSYQSPSSPNRPASPVSSDDSFGPAHSPGRPFDPTSNIISHPDIKPIHYSEPKCWCQVNTERVKDFRTVNIGCPGIPGLLLRGPYSFLRFLIMN